MNWSRVPRAPAARLLLLVLGLLPAACGEAAAPAPLDVAVEGDPLALAPWEEAWSEAERDTWCAGHTMQPIRDPDTGRVRVEPLEGVRLELLIPRPDGREPLVPVAETVTGADGSFRLGPVPQHAWLLRASREDRATTWGGVGTRIPGTVDFPVGAALQVGLRRAHRLRGRIVDRDGAGVPSVRLSLHSIAYREEVATDAEGDFEARPPEGLVEIRVLDPERAREPVVLRIPEEGDPDDVRIETAHTPPLSGWVVARDDGRPLAGATVVHVERPELRTRTDEQGRFTLAVPREGRIAAFGDGWAWRSFAVPRAGELEIRLVEGARVEGQVLDLEGRPVAGARILGSGYDRESLPDTVRGPLTDAEGRFRMTWMRSPVAGDDRPVHVLAVHRPGGRSQAVALPRGADADEPILLRLAGEREVRGRVLDDRGAPVRAAYVVARANLEPFEPLAAARLGLVEERGVATDEAGRYRITRVPGGEGVEVAMMIYGLELTRELPAGSAEVVDLDFALPPGHPLAGRVLDARGGPVPGAVVTARLLDAPGVRLERTDAAESDGGFRFEDLPEGRYALRADAPGFDIAGGADAAAGDEEVALTLSRSAELRFRLRFPEGAGPEADVPVRVTLDDVDYGGNGRFVVVEPDGGTDGPVRVGVVPLLRPGRWRMRAGGGVWRAGPVELEVDDGERRTIDVDLLRTLVLSVRLEDAEGRPIGAEPLLAAPLDAPGNTQRVTTADDGTAEVAGLRPGRWEVRAAPRDRAPLRTELEIPYAGDQPLVLRLPPSGDLAVRVVGPDGRPIGEAIVALATEAGTPLDAWPPGAANLVSRARADADGRVVFRGVRAGPVRVTAHTGGTPVTAVAEIAPGTETEIEVR